MTLKLKWLERSGHNDRQYDPDNVTANRRTDIQRHGPLHKELGPLHLQHTGDMSRETVTTQATIVIQHRTGTGNMSGKARVSTQNACFIQAAISVPLWTLRGHPCPQWTTAHWSDLMDTIHEVSIQSGLISILFLSSSPWETKTCPKTRCSSAKSELPTGAQKPRWMVDRSSASSAS